MRGLCVGLLALLRWLGELWDHLVLVRIPLLLVAIGAAMTLRVDQIGEFFFLLGAGGDQPVLDAVLAMIVSLLFGLCVWYSARVLYRFEFASRPALVDVRFAWLRKWAPRALGAAVPALMALGCLIQWWQGRNGMDRGDSLRLWFCIGVFTIEAGAILFVVARRREWVRRWQARRGAQASLVADPLQEPPLRSLRDLGVGYRIFQVALALNLLAFLIAWWWPHALGWIGTLALIQLSAIFFTMTGTVVLSVTQRHAVPVVTLFFAIALLMQLFASNDNHHVRQTLAQASYTTATPVIEALVEARQKSRKATPPTPAQAAIASTQAPAALRSKIAALPPGPIYLVSAEGGGIRAAAWTALVLARLDAETNGAFGQHVFAASGVSGGSLGIATWVAMRRLAAPTGLTFGDFHCGATPTPGDRCPARAFLTRDFLRPVLASMLLVDVTQRWLPWALLPDRGSTLEGAWERDWDAQVHGLAGAPDANAFAQGWHDGVARDPWLLFNTTVVSSGQRMVQQPFAFDPGVFETYFPGAVNGALRLQASAPLSAIVHNSARFSYVSPAGLLDPPAVGDLPALQLVDGGYFENSGTATLLGAERLLVDTLAGPGADTRAAQARVWVIHISNDPLVPPMLPGGRDGCLASATELAGEHQSATVGHVGELASPVVALLNTREARGELSRRAIVTESGTNVMHFRLCPGQHHLPLGWTLSGAAWTELARQLGDPPTEEETPNVELNQQQRQSVRAQLGLAPSP